MPWMRFFSDYLLAKGLISLMLLALVGCGGASDETPLVGDPPSSKQIKSTSVSSLLVSSRAVSSSNSSSFINSSSLATISSVINSSSASDSSSVISTLSSTGSSSVSSSTNSSSSALPLSYLMGGAIQGQPLNLTGTVTTIAGAGRGADGAALSASFKEPRDAAFSDGNLYVADTDNQTIRKVVIATGQVTTIAGAVGKTGSEDGIGAAARFRYPGAVAVHSNNLYVADIDNHTIRKIELASGAVTTLAGSAGESGIADGVGASARFSSPRDIVIEGDNLYVSSGNSIRKIALATSEVTTLAGAYESGTDDGIGAAAKFSVPTGLATDGVNLYVADTGNHSIRKILLATGDVTTLTVTAEVETGRTDEDGRVYMDNPVSIVIDGASIYVAEESRNIIRKISTTSGFSTVFVGSYGDHGSADGTGINAAFSYLGGLSSDGTNIYIADRGNHKIRKMVIETAVVTTFAGRNDLIGLDGTGTESRFVAPSSITTDGKNLYISDWDENSIRKIDIATHVVTTFALAGIIHDVALAKFYAPASITTDGVTLFTGGNVTNLIYKFAMDTAAVSTWFGGRDVFGDPSGVTTDGKNVYIVDRTDNTIKVISINSNTANILAGVSSVRGGANGAGVNATFRLPRGITTDGTNLYVADAGNSTIRKIVISSGVVSTLAGTAQVKGSTDGVGVEALFNTPNGITTDGTNLYVTDLGNNTVRKVVIATGVVTTLAGKVGGEDKVDGTGALASFEAIDDITTDGYSLYVIDSGTVRKIQ